MRSCGFQGLEKYGFLPNATKNIWRFRRGYVAVHVSMGRHARAYLYGTIAPMQLPLSATIGHLEDGARSAPDATQLDQARDTNRIPKGMPDLRGR